MSKIISGKNDFATKQPNLLDEWNYEKNTLNPTLIGEFSNKSAYWICKKCEHEWEAVVSSRSGGRGCPKCNSEKNTSFGEQAIYYYLHKSNIEVYNRYKLDNKYEIDIYLPNMNIGIEYDGYFFHKRKQEKDKYKEEKINSYNIKLLRIIELRKYDSIIKNDNCIYYIYDRGSNLSNAIKELFNKLNIEVDNDFVDVVRDYQLIDKFYAKSLKNRSILNFDKEMLVDFNYEKNFPIIPENLYISSGKRVWWKCHVCGEEYFRSPNEINAGCKCPKCSHIKRVKSLEKVLLIKNGSLGEKNPDYLKEWDYNNNSITPYEITEKSNKKVYWKCSVCGHNWPTSPSNRSQGKGCPKCALKIIGRKKSRKVVQYTLDGKYVKTYDSIRSAIEETGAIKISEVCSGNRKTSGGFIWKYLDEGGKSNENRIERKNNK